MGIYYRYAAAALILLFCADSYAVTRKTVNHGQSKASVINGNGASFQTPNGEAGYYGREYVDQHTAGNRFTTNDSPGASAKQKVTVKPTLNVNPRAAAKAITSAMRGGVPGVIASAAAAAIVEAVGGVIDDGQVKVPSSVVVDDSSSFSYYRWQVRSNDTWDWGFFPSAQAACDILGKRTALSVTSATAVITTENSGHCSYYFNSRSADSPSIQGPFTDIDLRRVGSVCPPDSSYNSTTGACTTGGGLVTPPETFWLSAEDWAAARDSDFTRDIIRASCEGSNAPARCYDEMSNWGDLQGPSSQTGPAQVTTTTKTNLDGTTSTTTTTTQNRYEYNFGPNYYNYSTTTKITQNTDGVVTETETSDGIPTDNPTQEEESTDYSFNDTEFPEVPIFYEQKYPDGLSGVWQQARADVDQSAFMQFLQGFVPSFSGSCPTFGLGFNIASWANYGTVQFSSICYVLDFVKIILLVTALFTFRKVTFGG